MQRLLAKHRFTDTDRALRFLTIRLESRPETQGLAAPIVHARNRMRETEELYQQALQARVASSAEIAYLDGKIDEVVMNLARDVLALLRGDRNDARYRKLFSIAPSIAMTPVGGDDQDSYVRNVLARLHEDPDLTSLRHYEPELSKQRDALQAAIEKRRTLAVPEATTDADRKLALDEAKRLYNRSAPQLEMLLEDKALVESYFLTFARGKGGVGEGDDAEGEE